MYTLPRAAPREAGLKAMHHGLRIALVTVLEANVSTILAMVRQAGGRRAVGRGALGAGAAAPHPIRATTSRRLHPSPPPPCPCPAGRPLRSGHRRDRGVCFHRHDFGEGRRGCRRQPCRGSGWQAPLTRAACACVRWKHCLIFRSWHKPSSTRSTSAALMQAPGDGAECPAAQRLARPCPDRYALPFSSTSCSRACCCVWPGTPRSSPAAPSSGTRAPCMMRTG